jgi:exopolysaccharide biosynthesis polyprenyl glycosylphosphotransferase
VDVAGGVEQGADEPLGMPLAPLPAARRWVPSPVLVGDALAGAAGALVVGALDLHDVPLGLVGLAAVAWVVALQLCRAYDPSVVGLSPAEYERLVSAALWSMLVLAILGRWLPPSAAFVALGVAVAASTLSRALLRWIVRRRIRRGTYRRRVVVTGAPDEVVALSRRLEDAQEFGAEVVGTVVPPGTQEPQDHRVAAHPSAAALYAAELDASILAVAEGAVDRNALLGLLRSTVDSGIAVLVDPGAVEVVGLSPALIRISTGAMLEVEEPRLRGAAWVLKAWIDRIGAGLLLLLVSPLLLFLAALVRLTSRGPAFFRQPRAGLRGRPFTIYKLRTMTVDAEDRLGLAHDLAGRTGPFFKMEEDPRITPVGRWLRRYSLDELPQLWNVVKGDMSLVGPRPLPMAEAQLFTPELRRRTLVRPGLTGLWQVSGRSTLSSEQAIELDLSYLDNWSLVTDLVILLRTVGVVVRGDGT